MMRRDRIPNLHAAVRYIARFNPIFVNGDETKVEQEILRCADMLTESNGTTGVSTGGFYVKLYQGDDPNGDIDVFVDPLLWSKAEMS